MCEEIAEVDVSHFAEWVSGIDFSEWPQQRKVDHQLRPAMVSDRNWHHFQEAASPIVTRLLTLFPHCHDINWLLSAVMPGHDIEPHVDLQSSDWTCRIHVPLISNPQAFWVERGQRHWMKPGFAYKVDTTVEHSIVNAGTTPRIHFMFDVMRIA
jgi:Aspartyl/Asparaginyl beta-hydroxylase